MSEHDYAGIKYIETEEDELVIDQLTHVMNRATIIKIANGLIADKTPFTLMILDLDNFKTINDSFGHLSGDFILKSVGEGLKEFCYGKYYVGRYGGDEFVILLPNVTDYDEIHKVLESIYERNKIFRRYYNDGTRDMFVTATLGCATFPNDEKEYEALFAKADKALYRGKLKGRNCYIIYVESKHKDIIVHEKAEGSLIQSFNSIKRLFDIDKGKRHIAKSVVDYLYSHLHCTNVYFLTEDKTFVCNYNDGEKMFMHVFEPHLDMMLNGDTIFFETPLTNYKKKDPELNDFIKERKIQSMMVSKLCSYGRNYGYIVITEQEITRRWQENEIALVMYVSSLLEMELIKYKK